LLQRADFIDHVGRENVLPHVEAALQRAAQINSSFQGVGEEIATTL
jgi:SulP family sulfate permease